MYTVKYARRLTHATNEAVDLVFFFFLIREVRAIARSSASGASDRSSTTKSRFQPNDGTLPPRERSTVPWNFPDFTRSCKNNPRIITVTRVEKTSIINILILEKIIIVIRNSSFSLLCKIIFWSGQINCTFISIFNFWSRLRTISCFNEAFIFWNVLNYLKF